MAANSFATDPLKVVVYNPLSARIMYTKIFVSAPKNVISAIKAGSGSVLRSYFGADYKRKLGAETRLPETAEAIGGDYSGGDYTGGDYSVDTSDIEQLLQASDETSDDGLSSDVERAEVAGVQRRPEAVIAHHASVEYVTDIRVYPEDKFSELRAKIYLATGIPTYRQHLFYIDKGRVMCMYKLYAHGLYQTDIREIMTPDKILDIPIDRKLYDLRDDLRVESLEDFQLLSDHLHSRVIYCVDLATLTAPVITQLVDLIKDTYRTELFYYGLIVKYWPLLTRECFYDYVIDEASLKHKYPDLAPTRAVLMQRYAAEREIIDYNYTHVNKAFNMAESTGVNIAIVQMTAMVTNPRTAINIRNLFDKLRVTRCVPELHAYVEHSGKKYRLRKRHVKNASDIQFPLGVTMKSGITIAISLHKQDQDSYHARRSVSTAENEQSRYLFLNVQPNGKYYIRSIWNEEDELDFDGVLKILKKFTDPIINGINALGKYVFVEGSSLAGLSRNNIQYQSLNMCVFWKKVMLDNTFKAVKQLWESYLRAGITAPRNIQQFDKYEFTFCKGMHDFDTNTIESIISASHNIVLNNYYAHLSNSSIKQKWNQNYEGRTVRMSHRTTDVRFEILSVREQEFTIFYRYIVMFIYRATHDSRVIASMTDVKNYKDVKRLRKLREQDPELYNIKKYGSEKTYSILCQKPRQPLIYTADEIKTMPQSELKKLTTYWNFTLGKPAYYGCPSRKFPHLTFIVGEHPKHYCLPCCGQTSNQRDSKKSKMSAICMSKHKYIVGDTADGLVSRHVMSYGKDIDQGRLSKIPLSAKNLLFNTLEDSRSGYYLFGVAQHFPAVDNMGVLYAAAEALDTTPVELLSELLKTVRIRAEAVFNTVLNGTLAEYFHNPDDFVMTLKELFIDGKLISREYHRFTQWQELFVELLHVLMQVNIFMLIDESGAGDNITVYLTDILASEMRHRSLLAASGMPTEDTDSYVFVLKKVNKYYPLFVVNPERYFKTFEVTQRKFSHTDVVVKLVYQMVQFHSHENVSINKRHTLTTLSEFCVQDYAIVMKYVNRQNLCYAVLLEAGTQPMPTQIYVPNDYSVHMANDVPVSFDTPTSTTNFAALQKFIVDFNKFIMDRYRVSNEMYTYEPLRVQRFLRCRDRLIGAMVNGMVYYCNIDERELMPGLPVDVVHDYREVNAAIMRRAPPVADNRKRLLGESLYNNYKYQLLLIEFVAYLERERNNDVRSEITKLIMVTNFKKDVREFMTSIHRLLKQTPGDFNILQKQLSDYYYVHNNKSKLVEDINSTVYEFDRITLNRLRRLSLQEVKTALVEICRGLVVEKEFDTRQINFPNIYLPCSSATNDYCAGGKLLLNSGLGEYIDILANDIKDDLRVRYLMSGVFADTVLSYLQFIIVPTEIITIYRIME